MPILGCFSDQDLRVRYYACESLYNVVKVARGAVLPHFSPIFNALSKIATDTEQTVKNGSELLDRLMKVGNFFLFLLCNIFRFLENIFPY